MLRTFIIILLFSNYVYGLSTYSGSTRAQIRNLELQLELYKLEHGEYPSLQNVEVVLSGNSTRELKDSWGDNLIIGMSKNKPHIYSVQLNKHNQEIIFEQSSHLGMFTIAFTISIVINIILLGYLTFKK
jgi:hypothetical protein